MANIKVNIAGKLFTGKVVTFPAPCDCDKVTDGLIINGETYTVCDAMGNCVTGTGGVWCAGAQVSVVLDCENKKAYIQNGKPTPAQIGAVSNTGDIMTGPLVVDTGMGSGSHFFSYDGRTHVRNKIDDDNYQDIMLGADHFVHTGKTAGEIFSNHILHTGNKSLIKSADIGAAAAEHTHSTDDITGLADALSSYGKIATGSYKGTETYGSSNKNSLTFEFTPKMLIISPQNGTSPLVMMSGGSETSVLVHGSYQYYAHVYYDFSGTAVEWYSEDGSGVTYKALSQFNSKDTMYFWLAIGE